MIYSKKTNNDYTVSLNRMIIPSSTMGCLPAIGMLLLYALATNTQSGWLFIMFAALLTLLIVDYIVIAQKAPKHSDTLTATVKMPQMAKTNHHILANKEIIQDEKGNTILSVSDSNNIITLIVNNHSEADITNLCVSFKESKKLEHNFLGHCNRSQREIEPSPAFIKLASLLYSEAKDASVSELLNKVAAHNMLMHHNLCFIKSIPAHGSVCMQHTLKATSRGRFPIFLYTFYLRSHLGFWLIKLQTTDCPASMYIKPEITNYKKIWTTGQIKHSKNVHYNDRMNSSDNFRGLHTYQEGEDLRLINWAASARCDELIVKEFQEALPQDKANIYLEWNCLTDDIKKISSELIVYKPVGFTTALILIASILYQCRQDKRRLTVLYRGFGYKNSENMKISSQIVERVFENAETTYALDRFLAEVQFCNNDLNLLEEGTIYKSNSESDQANEDPCKVVIFFQSHDQKQIKYHSAQKVYRIAIDLDQGTINNLDRLNVI
ncbi:MAG: DUF58 domain-containing protein [Candidatus Bruticola sp.]